MLVTTVLQARVAAAGGIREGTPSAAALAAVRAIEVSAGSHGCAGKDQRRITLTYSFNCDWSTVKRLTDKRSTYKRSTDKRSTDKRSTDKKSKSVRKRVSLP